MQDLWHRLLSQSENISEHMLQRYLAQDSHYYEDLSDLAGKTIVFKVQRLPKYLVFSFTRTKLKLSYIDRAVIVDSDLEIRGAADALLQFMLKKAARSYLLSTEVIQFSGDLFLLENFARLFAARNFDQGFLGARIPKMVLHASKEFLAGQRRRVGVLQKTSVDYLQEELKVIPSRRHFILTQEDLLNFAERLDRLEAKLHRFDV